MAEDFKEEERESDEDKKATFGKQMFAVARRDNGTQRSLNRQTSLGASLSAHVAQTRVICGDRSFPATSPPSTFF